MVAHVLAHLVEHALLSTPSRLLHAAPDGAAALRRQRGFGHVFERNALVPQFERPALRILHHAIAVFADRRHHQLGGEAAAQAHMPRGHHETGSQAFEIPFERTKRHFVEVVQIEDELPFRCRETAEVHQMAIAADRHHDARVGSPAQVVSLDDRTAAKERERRNGHATVAQWHQLLHAPFAALLEKVDRVAVDIASRAMTRALRMFARCPAAGLPFRDGAGFHAPLRLW